MRVTRTAWLTTRLRRIADAPLVALFVAHYPLMTRPDAERHAIERNLELAEDLGAETRVADARDVVDAILATARERNVTQIVLGHSTRSRWQELRGKSLVTQLIHAARGYDVLVVADADSAR